MEYTIHDLINDFGNSFEKIEPNELRDYHRVTAWADKEEIDILLENLVFRGIHAYGVFYSDDNQLKTDLTFEQAREGIEKLVLEEQKLPA